MRRFTHQLLMTAALMVLRPAQRAQYLEALALGFDAYDVKHEGEGDAS